MRLLHLASLLLVTALAAGVPAEVIELVAPASPVYSSAKAAAAPAGISSSDVRPGDHSTVAAAAPAGISSSDVRPGDHLRVAAESPAAVPAPAEAGNGSSSTASAAGTAAEEKEANFELTEDGDGNDFAEHEEIDMKSLFSALVESDENEEGSHRQVRSFRGRESPASGQAQGTSVVRGDDATKQGKTENRSVTDPATIEKYNNFMDVLFRRINSELRENGESIEIKLSRTEKQAKGNRGKKHKKGKKDKNEKDKIDGRENKRHPRDLSLAIHDDEEEFVEEYEFAHKVATSPGARAKRQAADKAEEDGGNSKDKTTEDYPEKNPAKEDGTAVSASVRRSKVMKFNEEEDHDLGKSREGRRSDVENGPEEESRQMKRGKKGKKQKKNKKEKENLRRKEGKNKKNKKGHKNKRNVTRTGSGGGRGGGKRGNGNRRNKKNKKNKKKQDGRANSTYAPSFVDEDADQSPDIVSDQDNTQVDGGKKHKKKGQKGKKGKKGKKNKKGKKPGQPETKASVSGFSSLLRKGAVEVSQSSSTQRITSDFTLGPVTVDLAREFNDGEVRKAKSTATTLNGTIVIEVNKNGQAKVARLKISPPSDIKTTGSLKPSSKNNSSSKPEKILKTSVKKVSPQIRQLIEEAAGTVLDSTSRAVKH
ncbi:E3 ubiquitin-protein ligase RBBP6 isoform X2 [Hyalella azteca]|uniref:E3 ubiquitin-protein ligase RBBP6 isoform X2 n=1 Tax=Hyalella azteca TaxID=294128 RepID=A0A8B7PBM6_HYAAZ|nr:E3 ubiquitin-protein ligase RBBP6 isoform X2 [Hyalella azteca]